MPKYTIVVDGLPEELEVELEELSKLYTRSHFGVEFVKISDWWIAQNRIVGMVPSDKVKRRARYGGSA